MRTNELIGGDETEQAPQQHMDSLRFVPARGTWHLTPLPSSDYQEGPDGFSDHNALPPSMPTEPSVTMQVVPFSEPDWQMYGNFPERSTVKFLFNSFPNRN